MTIVPVQDLYLEANFKETQIGLMRAGQPAIIHVDALSGADLHGTVSSFAPGTGSEFALLPPQNATGNFTKIVQRVPVRIHVDAGDEARKVLVPGLSVTVKVDTRERARRAQAHRVGARSWLSREPPSRLGLPWRRDRSARSWRPSTSRSPTPPCRRSRRHRRHRHGGHVDFDRLPHVRNRHDPARRLAHAGVRPAQVPARERVAVLRLLHDVRPVAYPGANDRRPDRPGIRGRER